MNMRHFIDGDEGTTNSPNIVGNVNDILIGEDGVWRSWCAVLVHRHYSK